MITLTSSIHTPDCSSNLQITTVLSIDEDIKQSGWCSLFPENDSMLLQKQSKIKK